MARQFNPKWSVNIIGVFNRAYGDKDVALRSALRPFISTSQFKQLYGDAIRDEIFKRTVDDNIDKNGSAFKKYSPTYKQSLIFKAYGKSSEVNLELTGSMMSSIRFKSAGQSLEFFIDGNENKNKARGHITGMEGKGVKRDFFGLPDDVLDDLMKETLNPFIKYDMKQIVDLFGNVASAQISLGRQSAQLDVGLAQTGLEGE